MATIAAAVITIPTFMSVSVLVLSTRTWGSGWSSARSAGGRRAVVRRGRCRKGTPVGILLSR